MSAPGWLINWQSQSYSWHSCSSEGKLEERLERASKAIRFSALAASSKLSFPVQNTTSRLPLFLFRKSLCANLLCNNNSYATTTCSAAAASSLLLLLLPLASRIQLATRDSFLLGNLQNFYSEALNLGTKHRGNNNNNNYDRNNYSDSDNNMTTTCVAQQWACPSQQPGFIYFKILLYQGRPSRVGVSREQQLSGASGADYSSWNGRRGRGWRRREPHSAIRWLIPEWRVARIKEQVVDFSSSLLFVVFYSPKFKAKSNF